jgi:hypothetical protein
MADFVFFPHFAFKDRTDITADGGNEHTEKVCYLVLGEPYVFRSGTDRYTPVFYGN